MGVGGRGPLAVASAFAVLLTGGLVTFTRQPPGCLTLVLASSQKKATLLSQIAGDYAGSRPLISTSGLHALIGTYFAASGRSSDLTEARLTDPTVIGFVRDVESAVEHYGDSVSTFLLNLQAADDANRALSYVSAIAMEEKEVLDYNRGNPLADPSLSGEHAAPRVPLVAIYPNEGTVAADHPYVILRAAWVTDAKRRAAQAFLSFLHAPAQQLRFQAAGFRDQSG